MVAYAAASVSCLSAYYVKWRLPRPRFWLVMAFILMSLGVNKQLDLQSFFTDIGRVIAKNNGWYSSRRQVQVVFVGALFAGTVVSAAIVAYKLRSDLREHLFPLLGLVMLLGFIVIRAVSFHHVDLLLKHTVGNVRINWLLEFGGIGVLLFSSLWYVVQQRCYSKNVTTSGTK